MEAAAPDRRIKVAVLGGGCGGMTAAMELTATPELRERYEVTVHQLGWRLGGKGASGRNAAAGNRIEEHGLHIWFGFYENAFRVMRDAYQELGRPPAAPLATLEDAFKGCNRLVLYDRVGERWHPYRIDMPPNFLRPGDGSPLPTFWEMADVATSWTLAAWHRLRDDDDDLDAIQANEGFDPPWFVDLAAQVAGDLLSAGLWGAEQLLELADRLTTARARNADAADARRAGHPWFLAGLLTRFRDWLWEAYAEERCDSDPRVRMFFTMLDVLASTVSGVVKDGVLEDGWDAINDYEWAEWLARHGAKRVTLGRTVEERAPILRAVYDVAFGFPNGEIAKADVAAGTATNDLLRLLFSYRGSLMYKMQAGMGDVVFTPMYEVLRRRGVKFEFFHSVTRLGVAEHENAVEAIDVVSQVDVPAGEYEPLVDVGGLGCWPSEPRWEQLADGDELRAAGVDFEAELNPLGREAQTLRRGTDFDEVVLAIPVGALAPLCSELMDRDERFRTGIETGVTVQTQAFQVWSRRDVGELGWTHRENSVAGCYVEPLDTYCDMSHLSPRESWGDGEVRSIAYFCGVLDERPGETREQSRERVRKNAVAFLEAHAPGLWPNARSAESGFDWGVLAGSGPPSQDGFATQYWRANVTPWDRYVLTPAGTVKHRLPSGESGFRNLKLAGDWTKNGIDGGCVEAAVISGIEAAKAITGFERPVAGADPGWLQPSHAQLPPYVEYGGRATAPGPFLSLGGRMRSFVLEGDGRRIGDLVRRTLNDPSGPEVSYRAIGSKVLLMIGGFSHVSSMAEPFDRWGAVQEICAAFWVPVAAGRDLGDVFVAERLGLAAPYVIVDNPMSYLGGRETYGYAKTMGVFEPADGTADRQKVSAFGGNFGRDEGAGWRPFLDLEAVGADQADAPGSFPLRGPSELMRHLTPELFKRNSEGEVVVPGMKLAKDLLEQAYDGHLRQVFLKQFRDASDGTRACYQSVVEAPIEIKRARMDVDRRQWNVGIAQLGSHPIGQEMGVWSQSARLALKGELDMICRVGEETGTLISPAATPPSPPAPDGLPAADRNGRRPDAADAIAVVVRDIVRIAGGVPLLRRLIR